MQTFSFGVLLGAFGSLVLLLGCTGIVVLAHQKKSVKIAVIISGSALFLIVLGYMITPTGMANIRRIMNLMIA